GTAPNGHVSILCTTRDSSIATQLHNTLADQGHDVTFTSLNDGPPENGCIISLLDLEEPFFYRMTSEKLSKLQSYLGGIAPSSALLWVTGLGQVGCKDPVYASTLGAARTIRSELAIDFATLELDLSRLPLRLYVDTII